MCSVQPAYLGVFSRGRGLEVGAFDVAVGGDADAGGHVVKVPARVVGQRQRLVPRTVARRRRFGDARAVGVHQLDVDTFRRFVDVHGQCEHLTIVSIR